MLAGFHDLKTYMVLNIAVMLHLLLMKLGSTAFEMHVSCNPMAVEDSWHHMLALYSVALLMMKIEDRHCDVDDTYYKMLAQPIVVLRLGQTLGSKACCIALLMIDRYCDVGNYYNMLAQPIMMLSLG